MLSFSSLKRAFKATLISQAFLRPLVFFQQRNARFFLVSAYLPSSLLRCLYFLLFQRLSNSRETRDGGLLACQSFHKRQGERGRRRRGGISHPATQGPVDVDEILPSKMTGNPHVECMRDCHVCAELDILPLPTAGQINMRFISNRRFAAIFH